MGRDERSGNGNGINDSFRVNKLQQRACFNVIVSIIKLLFAANLTGADFIRKIEQVSAAYYFHDKFNLWKNSSECIAEIIS